MVDAKWVVDSRAAYVCQTFLGQLCNKDAHQQMPLIYHGPFLQQSGSFRQMSTQMKGVRSSLEEQMGENEQLRVFMSSLRGSNLSDADFADSSVQVMRTIVLCERIVQAGVGHG